MGTPREICPHCKKPIPKATMRVHTLDCPKHPENIKRDKKRKKK
jgi:hypothetical protein